MTQFIHTLSLPEYIWLDFLREFFSQKSLVVDEDGKSIENRFRYLQVPEDNRPFDIFLEDDLTGAHPNTLPSIVIEDLGCGALGVALDKLSNWRIHPTTEKERSDLIRATYVFHCTSRERAESRLLAAIVSNAFIVFYEQLREAGFHKLEPWSIGKTTAIKGDAIQTYFDTPVQQTFAFSQTWTTVESGPSGFKTFCVEFSDDQLVRYVRTSMEIADPVIREYVRTSMDLEAANDNIYVIVSTDIVDPQASEAYIRTSTEVADPLTSTGYARTSMRVG